MKLIIMDFLRRWWGAYLLAAFFVGLMAALMDAEAAFIFLFILLLPFLFELGRKPPGLMTTLPVSRKAIALTYWYLAVVLPVLLMTGDVALVGLLFHTSGISFKDVVIVFVGSLALAGSISCFFAMVSPAKLQSDTGGVPAYLVLIVFWPGMLTVFILEFIEKTKHTTVAYLAVLIGLLLTIWGYLRCEKLIFGRGWKHPSGALPSARSEERFKTLKPRLARFAGVFFNQAWIAFVFGGSVPILFLLGSRPKEEGVFLPMMLAFSCMGCLGFTFGGVRFLRSLPLSTGRLALNLLFLPLLNSLATLAGLTMAQWLGLGHFLPPEPVTFFIPTAGAICVASSFPVGCSDGANGRIIGMILGTLGAFAIGEAVSDANWPPAFWWFLGLCLMVAAFFLNRHWLRSSLSYRAAPGDPLRR